MEASVKALGIDQLSLADRMTLVEEIWDSIIDEFDSLKIPPSHVNELDRLGSPGGQSGYRLELGGCQGSALGRH